MGGWAPRVPEDSMRPRRLLDRCGRPLNFTVRRYPLSAVPPIGSRGGVWRFAKPASDDAIAALRASAPVGIPSSYYNFLRITNGGEGDLGVDPGWFAPWPAEHVVQNNRQYQLAEWVPGLFGFGSNGGGECFAFDFRETGCGRIVTVPFIPLDLRKAVVIAESFEQFSLFVGMPPAGGTV